MLPTIIRRNLKVNLVNSRMRFEWDMNRTPNEIEYLNIIDCIMYVINVFSPLLTTIFLLVL